MRISSHSTSSDINIKLDEISNELKEIGINYVGHGVVNHKGEHTGYFSERQWGNVYIEKGYFFSGSDSSASSLRLRPSWPEERPVDSVAPRLAEPSSPTRPGFRD